VGAVRLVRTALISDGSSIRHMPANWR